MENLKQKLLNSEFFVIAEVGLNHDGSLGDAFRLIEEANKAEVDAIKFQLHINDKERTKEDPTPPHFKLEDRSEYYTRTSFNVKEWEKLKKFSHNLNLYFIISPFSHEAVDISNQIGVDGYKIAAGETSNLPLLEYINAKNKPVLLSTGMSNWEEISNAIKILKENLIVLFQCSSQYPCKSENVGLNIIKEMKEKYRDLVIGFSDHTLKNYASIAALMLGAKVFEKHFTLSKNLYSPDARFSLNPEEMKDYVEGLKFISSALKHPVQKDDLVIYKEMKYRFEKSIVATKDLNKEHILRYEDISFKKPGDGIRADDYKKILGKKLIKNINRDDKILYKDLI